MPKTDPTTAELCARALGLKWEDVGYIRVLIDGIWSAFDPLHDLNHAKICTDKVEEMGYRWSVHRWSLNPDIGQRFKFLLEHDSRGAMTAYADTEAEVKCLMLLAVKRQPE